MGAERKGSLTIAQFLDSITLDQENLGDLSSQLLAGAPYNLTVEDGSFPVPRKDSGAYIAALLEQRLQGQVDKANIEAMIADLPICITEDTNSKGAAESPALGSSAVEEERTLQKGDLAEAAAAVEGWEPTASDELSFKKQGHSQGDEESEISDERAETRKRQRQTSMSDAELAQGNNDGEVDTVSRTVIEPKISKVDVDVIPVKEARRVLNNRKSARKSYIRKKEKMKSMEERVARYEVDFANVHREYLRLWEDYKRLQEENLALKAGAGYSVPSEARLPPPSQRPASKQFWT